MTRDQALRYRAIIEQASASLDDKTASTAPELFPGLKQDGSLLEAGTRINWHGTVKKASADLWDTEDNNPDNAPNLWADLAYRDGIRIIPDVITTTLAFSEGELGWWDDLLYRSTVNGNVYTPAVYPDNWELVEM